MESHKALVHCDNALAQTPRSTPTSCWHVATFAIVSFEVVVVMVMVDAFAVFASSNASVIDFVT
jgi:hypothetical protein